MALISQTVKNLKGGISQQPNILRYPEQAEAQINAFSSETEGLQKRSPTVFTKIISPRAGDFGSKPLVHIINRDTVEQYQVVFTGTGIRVFGLDGKEYSVTGDMQYVRVSDPQKMLRCVTVADYTFIVNRTWTVQANGNVTDPGFRTDGDCIINVRGGQFGRTLRIHINGGTQASLTLPDGSDAKQTPQTDAQYIVSQLAAQLRTNMGGWTINEGSGFIHIIAPGGDNIRSVATEDGYANQLINAVTHEAQSFTKLPLEAPNGYKVKISATNNGTSDKYYVQYDALNKVWRETVGWGVQVGLDARTMPWALVRQANGSFQMTQLGYANRTCGDNDTNPMPSLVGQTINDVFFFRNRLGFLSGENIVMSRTAKYFNFFPPSVANLSDDDPIDVAVSHNRISILKYAVPFSEQLLLWSDQAQFVLSSSGVLTPKSIQLDLTTEFDVDDTARPYGVGRGVYFAAPRASFTSIKRYYAVQDVSDVKDAEDISAHVPSYIPNGVFSIHGSGTENFACVLTTGAPNKLFMYKYLFLDGELKQQAWSHWEFSEGTRILAAQCIGSTMYLILENDQIFMARIHFTKNTVDFSDEPYRIYMDRKIRYVIPKGTYNDDTYQTTFNLSNVYGGLGFWKDKVSCVFLDGQVEEFTPPNGVSWEGNQPIIRLNGNREGEVVFLGANYEFYYEFSKFLIKKTAEDGSTATEDIGRLQLRRAWVNYEDSGAFLIQVENTSRLFEYMMAGGRLGSDSLRVGYLNVGTGQFRFPVVGNAQLNVVRLISDNTTPLNVIGCGWEGNYNRRSSGI